MKKVTLAFLDFSLLLVLAVTNSCPLSDVIVTVSL